MSKIGYPCFHGASGDSETARQREGIEIAKRKLPGDVSGGKYTGWKPIEIDWTRFGQLYGE